MKLTHKMIFEYHPNKHLNWDELRESKKIFHIGFQIIKINI